MTEKGNIEKIFSEGFENFQADANGSVWNVIENQLQVPASVPAAGVSVVTKTIIGLTTAAIVTASIFYFNLNKEENIVINKKQPQSENVSVVPTQPTESVPVSSSDDKSLSAKETVNNLQIESLKSENKTNTSTETLDLKAEVEAAIPNQSNLELDKTDIASEDQKDLFTTNPNPVIGSTITDDSKPSSDLEKESSTIKPPQNFQPTNTPTTQQTQAYKPFPFKYNVITPNGDGSNDVYALYADGLDIISVEAFILDANSRRVGFINNMSSYWDGKDLKGNILPNGTYRIIVSATGADGTNYKGQDFIIIKR